METETAPLSERTHRQNLIWIVPILALLVGAYVVHRELMSRGPRITIDFSDGAGLSPDQTKVIYKGITVGVVTEVKLRPDLSGVRVEIEMIPGAGEFARQGSQFWINRPQISLRGVRGLETLLSGVSIAVEPGQGPPAAVFTGLNEPPIDSRQKGSQYLLSTDHKHGIDVGTPVSYRGIAVGYVNELSLAADARNILIQVKVYAPYDQLVRDNTVFWNASGVDVSFGLFRGLRVRDGGAESLLQGSIAFATPDAPGQPLAAMTTVPLEDKLDERWLKWSPAIDLRRETETVVEE